MEIFLGAYFLLIIFAVIHVIYKKRQEIKSYEVFIASLNQGYHQQSQSLAELNLVNVNYAEKKRLTVLEKAK